MELIKVNNYKLRNLFKKNITFARHLDNTIHQKLKLIKIMKTNAKDLNFVNSCRDFSRLKRCKLEFVVQLLIRRKSK